MKYLLTYLLLIIPLFSSDRNGVELPIGLTEEEKGKMHIIEEMGRETVPPPTPIRNIAEFERMQGVLIRYPFGISTSIIKEMAEDVIVYCLVSSGSQNSANNSMSNAGVNMDNVEYITGPVNSWVAKLEPVNLSIPIIMSIWDNPAMMSFLQPFILQQTWKFIIP